MCGLFLCMRSIVHVLLSGLIVLSLFTLCTPAVAVAMIVGLTIVGYVLHRYFVSCYRCTMYVAYVVLFILLSLGIFVTHCYHRVGIVLRYPVAVTKACMHHQAPGVSSTALVMQASRYVLAYLASGEYAEQGVTTLRHDYLLDYHITFFSYYDLQNLFYEVFARQIYAFSTSNPTPFIIDCGSNIGVTLLFLKKMYPQAHIIGFEPGKAAFNVLLKNVKDNGLTDVEVYNKALSNKEGTVSFFVNKGNQGCTRMNMMTSDFGCTERESIECTRLSHYITKPVDFLKIDVEGAEGLILEDLAQSGKLALVKRMAIEYHHHLFNNQEDKLATFLKLLEDNNFGYQLAVDDAGAKTPCAVQYPLIYAYNKKLM